MGRVWPRRFRLPERPTRRSDQWSYEAQDAQLSKCSAYQFAKGRVNCSPAVLVFYMDGFGVNPDFARKVPLFVDLLFATT
jgi:hypothetical protein